MNIPEGWQLVPKELTEEMIVAGQAQPFMRASVFLTAESIIDRYRAMLAAAPHPPAVASDNAAVEAAAAAMFESNLAFKNTAGTVPWTWDLINDENKRYWRDLARVALASLRKTSAPGDSA